MRSRVISAVAAVGIAGMALTGCSSDGGGSSSNEPIEMRSWIPNISNIVDQWNEENPDSPVNLSQQAAGDDATFATLVAAATSGAAPCRAQTDIKWVTSLVSQGVLQDVTDAAAQYEDDYVPGGWSSVNVGEATYGLPIGSGSMVLYYNKAKLTEYGIDVPTTWEEYAAAAEKVATEHPGEYLAGLSADDTEKFQSYVQQAGGEWWSIDADAVSGDWSVAPMPTWGDSTATANNGGSQLMVLDDCENVEGALELANYLTTNTDGLLDLGLFPAVEADELPTPDALSTFYDGADVYALLQESAENLETPWTFAPTYSSLSPKIGDLLNDAVTDATTLTDVLDTVQSMSMTSLKDAGISASEAK